MTAKHKNKDKIAINKEEMASAVAQSCNPCYLGG
jgi:hypothetical protein